MDEAEGEKHVLRPRIVDTQNRVVLPPEVLKALRLRQGDFVAFQVEGARVSVRKVRLLVEG